MTAFGKKGETSKGLQSKKKGLVKRPMGKTFWERISSMNSEGGRFMSEIKTMGSSDFEKAFIKATRPDEEQPKEVSGYACSFFIV